MTGGVGIVAEGGLVALLADPDVPGLIAVARRRGRGGWRPLDADAVVDALEGAGDDALVAVRPRAADPGADALAVIARAMGREVLRLPHAAGAAARALGWSALLVGTGARDAASLRGMQALAGTTPGISCAARPTAIARWARMAWRPCGWCRGGGLPGHACGRCGAALPVSGGAQ